MVSLKKFLSLFYGERTILLVGVLPTELWRRKATQGTVFHFFFEIKTQLFSVIKTNTFKCNLFLFYFFSITYRETKFPLIYFETACTKIYCRKKKYFFLLCPYESNLFHVLNSPRHFFLRAECTYKFLSFLTEKFH